ncbi:MAG: deoxyguanosinetriphosphate triphosphohydrolase [Bacteroidales bacterium]|nr:deoxyguanosinetriphosphate triphosphohydrolase [Bacteroidales bacterium]
MEWDRLLTTKRFGQEKYHDQRQHARSDFQRDYDRLIFSSPFRRLQNKTQVFPLPGSIFVHNRLTHSLEVSCVGRSLGNNVSNALSEKYKDSPCYNKLQEIGAVVAAACLAHDLGNPPFGHSGEKAIATYFSEGRGQSLREYMSKQEWEDLVHFEGNANAFRLLTHQFNGRREGGFALTYSTLASIVKYPYISTAASKKGKLGFFSNECESFKKIADDLGIIKKDDNGTVFARHPLVFLVEAADDICYQIMDIEDAHKLKLLTTEETKDLFLQYFDDKRKKSIYKTLEIVDDVNEQIAYLRSCVIGGLVEECSKCFVDNEEDILQGTFHTTLISQISDIPRKAYENCTDFAYKRLYRSSDVVDIELAGHQIISILLDKMIYAVENPAKSYSMLLLDRIPKQYETKAETKYERIMAVLDYISGMTDVYALDLYRKIYGMSLPSL